MEIPLLGGLRADGSPDPSVAERTARAWLRGGVVGLPTETVYGLAADAQDPDAVARVYEVKGRPADHPLIVHVAGVAALRGWSAGRNPAAEQLAAAFWPGALTVVVARGDRARDFITGGQDTVALRCPDHAVARACLEALAAQSGDPARGVAAPSANRFGRVSPTSAADVLAEVGARMDPARDLVLDGGPCAIGVESTIVDCTSDPPRVLRLGAISQDQIDAVLATGRAIDGAAGPPGEVRAPGSLEAHYSPAARVLLVEGGAGEFLWPGARERVGLIAGSEVRTPEGWTRLAAPSSAEEYARDLYAALRRADALELIDVIAVLPDSSGGSLALAVRDRLTRASRGTT